MSLIRGSTVSTYRNIESERESQTQSQSVIVCSTVSGDNLIKLFIVDIYHVIKHAMLYVYNNNIHTQHRSGIALDRIVIPIFISSLHVSF